MSPFLQQCAKHYFKSGNMEDICFVFPNRRSMVFFRKYLSECVRESGVPMRAPAMYTINDFFAGMYRGKATDRLHLMLELYGCYCSLQSGPEPLDEFIFWGDILLADFDDTDKYLADASRLFTNAAEFKGMQDDFSYLTDVQRAAITSFLNHFKNVKEGKDAVKRSFMKLWNILGPLYTLFNKTLLEKGMAYEGMIYRNIAERLSQGESVKDTLQEAFPGCERFVFTGLNALNECEKTLMRKMRDAGLAEFVWDYVSAQIKDPANKSSFFMKQNVRDFPQAFPVSGAGVPEITVVSIPSAIGQVKLAPEILSKVSGDPVETALVLPDENLLLPLLEAIPPEYESINVTMGYPMKSSGVYTLLKAIGQMQLSIRWKNGEAYFYHRALADVFSAGLLDGMLSREEQETIRSIKAEGKYYTPAAAFRGGPALEMIFRPVVRDVKQPDQDACRELCKYLSDIVAFLGRSLTHAGDGMLELDFAKHLHTRLNLLEEIPLKVMPGTWIRILDSLVQGVSVPFQGEPLHGLQVMGPLETRALDFRNLVIMSAAEGIFPRRSVSSSFIPPELRKGFGLPTYEYQDAVWAYYFYRLLQRAEKVWLIYDSRTEGLQSGEESRYIKQLEYHFGIPLRRVVASAEITPVEKPGDIAKTAEDIQVVRETELSASALQDYLSCPAKFYYKVVKKLEVPEDVAESLDAGMLGNVFHKVMQILYSGKQKILPADLSAMLADEARLKSLIRQEILHQMNSFELAGRNLVLAEVILDYVKATLEYDKKTITAPGSLGYLEIVGLEKRLTSTFEGFRIKGFVDRIDRVAPGEIRIVDYKTGKVEDSDILITDDNAAAVTDKLFGESNSGRPKIALQLYLYGRLVHDEGLDGDDAIVNSIYSTARILTDPLRDMRESKTFSSLVRDRLKGMLSEIVNPALPFRRKADPATCAWCDFKDLCGR